MSAASAAGRIAPSVRRVCTVAMLGTLLAQLDATIVNVSLTGLAADLGSGLGTIQWVASGYLLALTLVLPLSGWLVDRAGAKAVYLGCFAAFTLSSALCGLAWSAPSLIAFRVLQGASGGLLAPMAQMSVARVAGANMARIVGIMAMPVMAAPILGPIVAGTLLQHASWRWLFLVNLPVGGLALVLAALFLPDDRGERRPRDLDWAGLALVSPGLAALLFGIDRLGTAVGAAALAAGLVLLAAFLRRAARMGAAALIDLRLFRIPVFAAGTLTLFLWNGVVFAGQMLIPAFLIAGCGREPAEMGWMLMPLGLGMLIPFPLMGRLTDRFGLRRVSVAGVALTLATTLALTVLAIRGLDLAVLLPTLFLRGIGQGAVGAPTLTAAYAPIPRPNLPMATTALNLVQRLGGPSLTTLVATFLAWRLGPAEAAPGASATAFAAAFALLGGLQALTLAAALRLPARRSDVAVT